MGFSIGQMGQYMKVAGFRTRQMGREDLCIAMGMSTKESGAKAKRKGRVCTFTVTEQSISVSGRMTGNMGMGLKPGPMGHDMMAVTLLG
jgi:hypothetical protein